MRSFALTLLLALVLAGGLAAQTTGLSGVVSDPSGAVVPSASVALTNAQTNLVRETQTDSQGRYSFSQVTPGKYNLTVKASGFAEVSLNSLELLVNQPATVAVALKVGATSTTVTVEAGAVQVNTVDASLGNAVAGQMITQLPFEARNVVGLLAAQPGVVFLGEPDPGALNDARSGAVNGGKSDQANITMDGVDVNDQQSGAAFTSVLRATLDSVQEFRTTTTNGGADMGRSSGAQVALVTKGGSNTVHGSLYEYLRNTNTSANSFFSNSAGIPRAKLNRNVFGASVGGPIRKNRLFYFLNYEGRRDASAVVVGPRTVPTADFRAGNFTYQRTNGSTGVLSPSDVKNLADPAHIGEDPAVLSYLQKFPLPNITTVGDGLNTSGFIFNASTPLRWNTYIAKFDYTIDSAGKHQIFWRGNLQNDNYANGVPTFPGQPPSSVFLENSKGYAVGYTAVLKPTLISTFRYGYTRQGAENTGAQVAAATTLRDLSNLYATSRGLARIIPVHTISDDVSWTKGSHNLSFGGVIHVISNARGSTQNSFSDAVSNASWLSGTGSTLLVPDAKNATPYKRQMSNILGLLTQVDHQVNYDLTGSVLPEGAVIHRNFHVSQYEMFAQDSWRVTRGLTVTGGVRWSLDPPPTESNGYMTSANVSLGDWFDLRGALAAAGKPQSLAPAITYNLSSATGGRSFYPNHKKNFAPRIALAYSPQGSDGLSKFLFGGPGRTSIRAGYALFYDLIAQGLVTGVDAGAFGFSTKLTNPASASATVAPRFTDFFGLPTSSPYYLAAPKGGFPQTYPNIFAITGGLDDSLRQPYTENFDFSIGREFKGGFFVQVPYLVRFFPRPPADDDLSMPTNLVDTKSGMTYNQAAGLLSQYTFANTPVANVPKIAYWENLWPAAASSTLSATQRIYQQYLATGGDFTTALSKIDGEDTLDGTCQPACSIFGPYAIFNPQYGSLSTLRSIGYGNYNAMQWTIRKRFSQGYAFDFNYTWSKSQDLTSTRAADVSTGGLFTAGQIINAYYPGQMKAVSNYDTTHIFSANAVAELPFGRGKMFLHNANGVVNNIVGGWQLSAVFRNTSGFPVGVGDGLGWPTNWEVGSFADQTGIVPATRTSKNAPAALAGKPGGPNIFATPLDGYNAYCGNCGTTGNIVGALAGESGQRNGLRGDGVFTIDMGLGKRFHLFNFHDQPHSLQIRAEAFNLTNTVRFDPRSASLDITNQARFGQYSNVLGRPRVFQFSMRYEF